MKNKMNIEDMTSDDYYRITIPENVYNVFNKEFDNFIDSCYSDSIEFLEDDEDFQNYLEIFLYKIDLLMFIQ